MTAKYQTKKRKAKAQAKQKKTQKAQKAQKAKKTYKILDNGGTPYVVEMTPTPTT